MHRYVVSALSAIAAACSPVADAPTAIQPHLATVGPGKGDDPDRIRVRDQRREGFTLVVAGCLSEPLVVAGQANLSRRRTIPAIACISAWSLQPSRPIRFSDIVS